MVTVICKEACTVPGRGYIGEGERYDANDLDPVMYPFLKHFTDKDGKDIKAKKEAKKEETQSLPGQPEGDVFPRHLGGGTWELSNGSKVRGNKEEATKAEQDLAASA